MLQNEAIRQTFKKAFARLLSEKDATQKEVAAAIGVSPATVSSWLTGSKVPRMDKVDALCRYFGVPRETFFAIPVTISADTRREVVTQQKYIPVIGTVRCGPDGPAYENIDEYVAIDTNCRADEVKAIRCEGDSMTPDIHPGDLAFIHLQDDVPSGAVALCVIDGEEGTLKRVKYDSKRSFVVLESVNPEYAPRVFSGPDMQKVKVLGRVVETRRKW